MKRILEIGMDVHSTNYTLCTMEPMIGSEDRVFANIQLTPDRKNTLMFCVGNDDRKYRRKRQHEVSFGQLWPFYVRTGNRINESR